MGVAALWAGFVAVVIVVAVLITAVISNERHLSDDCHSIGGIPVQGDSADGHPVVCLDPLVVLND